MKYNYKFLVNTGSTLKAGVHVALGNIHPKSQFIEKDLTVEDFLYSDRYNMHETRTEDSLNTFINIKTPPYPPDYAWNIPIIQLVRKSTTKSMTIIGWIIFRFSPSIRKWVLWQIYPCGWLPE